MPQNASFVQTNKAFSWETNDIFVFSAIKIRDINGFSQVNRMEIANIKSFAQLTVDWDGYDAAPISPIAIEKAIHFIHEINKWQTYNGIYKCRGIISIYTNKMIKTN